jgi:hypothetical protein
MATIYPSHRQRNAPLSAKVTAMLFKPVGCRLHTMVNVQGMHLTRPLLSASQEQGGGVSTTAVRYRQGQSGRKSVNGSLQ